MINAIIPLADFSCLNRTPTLKYFFCLKARKGILMLVHNLIKGF